MRGDRENCLNCHFCAKIINLGTGDHPLSLKSTERQKVKEGDFSFLVGPQYLECHKGQWSEALKDPPKPELRASLDTKKCDFFHSHKKGRGKFFPGIERELEFQRISRAEKTAHRSLFIAALSLIVAVIK